MDAFVIYGYCHGCEADRWLIVDADGKWLGCRRTEHAATEFAALIHAGVRVGL